MLEFQGIESNILTNFSAIAFLSVMVFQPEVIKSLLSSHILSTESVPHFKFCYCNSFNSFKITVHQYP